MEEQGRKNIGWVVPQVIVCVHLFDDGGHKIDCTLIKKYIDSQPQKIVAKMDLDKNKIEYQGIFQG